jgi:hypothetical protein
VIGRCPGGRRIEGGSARRARGNQNRPRAPSHRSFSPTRIRRT